MGYTIIMYSRRGTRTPDRQKQGKEMESRFFINTFWLISIIFLIVLLYSRWATCTFCVTADSAQKTYGFLVTFAIIYPLMTFSLARDLYLKSIWANIFWGAMIGYVAAVLVYIIQYSFLLTNQINDGTADLDQNSMIMLVKFIGLECFLRGTWLFGLGVGIVNRISHKKYMGE